MQRAVPAAVEPLEARRLFSSSAVPRPDHVVVAVYENHSYSSIVDNPDAPYINSLARQGASFTQYRGLTAPSQPNYIALFSGSQQGVKDNNVPYTFSAPSLGGQLIAAGLDFAGYSEDLPYPGFTGTGHLGYRRRHNPWVDFTDVPPGDNLPFSQFPAPGRYDGLPTVSFVVPNISHGMHNGDVPAGDTWLKTHLDPYVQWAKTHNSLFVLTFDETDHKADKNIPTIFVGQQVRRGTYADTFNHYNLLRTIEDMYGLAHLGNAATAAPITDAWNGTTLVASADAYAADSTPSANYGKSATLLVKTNAAGLNRDTFFRFDTSAVAGTIRSARLRFYGGLTKDGTMSTGVFAVANSAWAESRLNWLNRPALGARLGTVTVRSTANDWYEVDVSAYLNAERAAGRKVVSLALHALNPTAAILKVNARDAAANRPQLVVS
jgi:acid phosphatase